MRKISRDILRGELEKEARADFDLYRNMLRLASKNLVLRGELHSCLGQEAKRLHKWYQFKHREASSERGIPFIVKDLAVKNRCPRDSWGFLFL